jgi:hypothetical protein
MADGNKSGDNMFDFVEVIGNAQVSLLGRGELKTEVQYAGL